MKLKIKSARVLSLTKYPSEEGCTQVLLVAGIFTHVLARKLQILEGCYQNIAEEGKPETWVPRHYESYPSPGLRIDGATIQLGERDFEATLIHKIKISQPKTGGDSDITLEIRMRIHFGGKEPLFAWMDRVNKDEFTLGLNARQEDLRFGDEPADEEEESGADAAEPDGPCISCNNSVPYQDGSTTIHDNGQACTRKQEILPPLASAAAMGHGRKRKQGVEVQ